jgi:glycosyltransferase involved in cell wall biosynthesis
VSTDRRTPPGDLLATGGVRVGVLSREFFEPSLGRMGGFGFAARSTARLLAAIGHEPVLVAGAASGPDGQQEADVDGIPVVFATGTGRRDARRWRAGRFDLLLSIDWHWTFLPVTRALPRTPVVVWSRDPRSDREWDRIATLALPGAAADPHLEPPGAGTDVGLALLARRSRRWRRPVRYRFTDEFLVERFARRFGFEPPGWQVLGTPVDPAGAIEADPARAADSAADTDAGTDAGAGLPVGSGRPWCVFLGRLDPIKRPWVFEDVAARLPGIDFVVLGQQHLGDGWSPTTGANLHHLGHVEGAAKDHLLAGAVATVNTSIHEAIPLSLLESLHHATPLVACLDPGGIVGRYGVAVPEAPGDGLAAAPALAAAIEGLAADPRRCAELGDAGRSWVVARHSRDAFVAAFTDTVESCGLDPRG